MKKIIMVMAAALLLTTTAFAEGFIIKGGLTYGNVMSKDLIEQLKVLDIKSYTGWHAGIGYQTGSVAGFTFQPELQYNQKGMKYSAVVDDAIKFHYLELPVNVQWGVDLIVARPFILVSPYVGYCLKGESNEFGKIEDLKNRLEYGLGVGAGISIWKVQISAKYSWNFGNVANLNEYWQKVTEKNKTNGGLEVSIALCL